MHIKKIRIQGYKSIEDSGYIDCDKPFLVLAGKNNVGKTAFIEAIYRGFQGVLQHPKSSGGSNTNGILQDETVTIEIIFNSTDLSDSWFVPESPNESINIIDNTVFALFEAKKGQITCIGFGVFDERNQHKYLLQTAVGTAQVGVYRNIRIKESSTFIQTLYALFHSSILFISPNRIVPNTQQINTVKSLSSDGSNLHTLMHNLHNNHEEVFEQIQSAFKKIFPEVIRIRTPNINQNQTDLQTNIMLDFENYKSLKLQDCGSGFTHVLILLCALYLEQDKIILFDEPHSFLHPSAEKAIYDIAKNFNNHQFIFTTHSPILINYPIDKSLYLVSKERGKSIFNPLVNVKELFDEIGLTNSDFALSEKVIFVEGETEERVLPLILNHFSVEQIGYNYKVINFNGGDRGKYGELKKNGTLYERILGNLSSSPIPYVILIDRDDYSPEEVRKMIEAAKGKMIVLHRREIENYFLHSEAIYSVLSAFSETATYEDVKAKIENYLEDINNRDLYKHGCQNQINDVRASKLLIKLFSEHFVDYSKPRHGKMIVEWLIEHGIIEDLEQIALPLKEFILS